MLKEMLGINTGILSDLHKDHQEVAALLQKMIDSSDARERGDLIKEIANSLLPHAHAEQNVLYKRMEKSEQEASRKFALEGTNEHAIVEKQVELLMRERDKASERWTAEATVLQELVEHHVAEEESTGFSQARSDFDSATLEKLGEQFRQQKEKLMAAG
ncbi:MAG: hemerythrin domain-containing protein [Alphaproteobacteria bacterium]|nr:hemerythrin domain-containing protein [Alphaproteobacteria bacterium]